MEYDGELWCSLDRYKRNIPKEQTLLYEDLRNTTCTLTTKQCTDSGIDDGSYVEWVKELDELFELL